METLLNSTVLAAAVTGFFALVGTVAVYRLSRSKQSKGIFRFRKKRDKDTQNNLTYLGYETLLKQNGIELQRLYDVAEDREKLIGILRAQIDQLYEIIRKKDEDISHLRHHREYTEQLLRPKKD